MANPLTLIIPLDIDADQLPKLALVTASAKERIDAALKTIGTVHYARLLIMSTSSPNLQLGLPPHGPFAIAVITEYDGSFNAYIQDFVNNIGDVFDDLLAFTADAATLCPVKDHLTEFEAYITKNDLSQHVPNDLNSLYSAYPQTVQQILAGKFPPS